MKISEVIAKVHDLGISQHEDELLVQWLSDVEGLIKSEILSFHHKDYDFSAIKPFNVDEDMDTELVVPEPYAELYLYYLMAQIYYFNGEDGRYNSAMIKYNSALSTFANHYNRHNMPCQNNVISI